LALAFLVVLWRLDLASAQVGRALRNLDFLFEEDHIGANSVSLGFGVGFLVLVGIAALDGRL
jgi:hypothetical protein